jgi:hypothetical protein
MQPEEREFVPVATLEHDLTISDVEKAAASKPLRITPLQDGPLAILKQVLRNADMPSANMALIASRPSTRLSAT